MKLPFTARIEENATTIATSISSTGISKGTGCALCQGTAPEVPPAGTENPFNSFGQGAAGSPPVIISVSTVYGRGVVVSTFDSLNELPMMYPSSIASAGGFTPFVVPIASETTMTGPLRI